MQHDTDNALVLPSKKRKTKVKLACQTQTPPRKLSKKQRKRLEHILSVKAKKEKVYYIQLTTNLLLYFDVMPAHCCSKDIFHWNVSLLFFFFFFLLQERWVTSRATKGTSNKRRGCLVELNNRASSRQAYQVSLVFTTFYYIIRTTNRHNNAQQQK